ncbi:hypothetical protein D3C74_309570 [compost metagenome]
MAAASLSRDFRTRYVDVFILSVIHKHRALRHPVADHRSGRYDAVAVIDLQPIVIVNLVRFRILVADPHGWTAPEQGQHVQIILVRAMDVPFAVRRQVTQYQCIFATLNLLVSRTKHHRRQRRLVDRQRLPELQEDLVIQIKMLASG